MNGWQQTLLEWAYTLCAPGTAHAWEIYDRIVNIYLGEGRVEEALKIGDQLDDPNCYYLGKLASSLARIGRSDLSHRIIASIEAYYQIAPADRRFSVDDVLSSVHGDLGLMEAAKQYAVRIDDIEIRTNLISKLADKASGLGRQAEAKHLFDDAIETALMIPDREDMIIRLISIARLCGGSRLASQGLTAVNSIRDPLKRAEAFAELAAEYARVAPGSDALVLLRKALEDVRQARADLGETAGLIRLVVIGFAWCLEEGEVETLLRSLRNTSITPAIMAEVAEIYAHRGLHVAARSILLGALRAAGAMNGILLNQLAEVALRMTELEIAFEALNIPVTEHFVAKRRVENLSRLAAAYAKRDDKPRALNVLRSAVGIIEQLQDGRAWLLRKVAVVFVEACDTAEALRLLANVHRFPEMTDGYWRALTILNLRDAFLTSGKIPGDPEMSSIQTALNLTTTL